MVTCEDVVVLAAISATVSTVTSLLIKRRIEPVRGLGACFHPPQKERRTFGDSFCPEDRERLLRHGWINEDGTPSEKFKSARGPRG